MSRQYKGFALVSALLVVALVTATTVAMAVRLHQAIDSTTDEVRFEQARQHIAGVERWAAALLKADARKGIIDSDQDNWNKGLNHVAMERGSITNKIEDMQGRFNLNNLVISGDDGELFIERFGRLLRLLSIDESLMHSIADWVDYDQNIRQPNGAEDAYYLSLSPSYRSANRPMIDVSELLRVRGVTESIYKRLRPFVSVLPPGTSININTAPVEVLNSLAEGMTRSHAEAIRLKVSQTPFAYIGGAELGNGESERAGFLEDDLVTGLGINPAGLDTRSGYFMSKSEVRLDGGYDLQASILLKRNAAQSVQVLSRRYGE